jgi:hypothetical protein
VTTIALPAEPCSDCGTSGGFVPVCQRRPARWSGERYGMPGVLCRKCQRKHWFRLWKAGTLPAGRVMRTHGERVLNSQSTDGCPNFLRQANERLIILSPAWHPAPSVEMGRIIRRGKRAWRHAMAPGRATA